MDKQSTVVFRNVGQLYFPETRVECHYSLTCDQQWSSRDWIGIIKVDDCLQYCKHNTYKSKIILTSELAKHVFNAQRH